MHLNKTLAKERAKKKKDKVGIGKMVGKDGNIVEYGRRTGRKMSRKGGEGKGRTVEKLKEREGRDSDDCPSSSGRSRSEKVQKEMIKGACKKRGIFGTDSNEGECQMFLSDLEDRRCEAFVNSAHHVTLSCVFRTCVRITHGSSGAKAQGPTRFMSCLDVMNRLKRSSDIYTL